MIPYYLPINQSTEILFKPIISLNQNFELLEKYHLSTFINNKRSGGDISISVDNIKNQNSEDLNTTFN